MVKSSRNSAVISGNLAVICLNILTSCLIASMKYGCALHNFSAAVFTSLPSLYSTYTTLPKDPYPSAFFIVYWYFDVGSPRTSWFSYATKYPFSSVVTCFCLDWEAFPSLMRAYVSPMFSVSIISGRI